MSLSRTPPKQCSGSTPNLSINEPRESLTDVSNITLRQEKRKRGDMMEDDLNAFIVEIKNMFNTASEAQNHKLSAMHSAIEEIRAQNCDISKSMEFLSAKYDEIKTKLDKCEKERGNHLSYIRELENRVEYLERNSRNTSIEIRNIPKIPSESKQSLVQLVKNIGTAVESTIEDCDIKDIFRYRSKSASTSVTPVVVEFTTARAKEKMLSEIRQFRQDKKTNLTTSLAQIDTRNSSMFVSDSLSQLRYGT
ncbi:unnamed protein product [Arctia plantaginis]|uniref:Uncharacterized protein n=1 Tax=Arctia plantaginis TaxID=874455 RepID=A0A8S1BHB2_ARCPL|nr:unnamed protein product [Arctia plantaginis]